MEMKRKQMAYRIGSIISVVGLIAVCVVAFFPIYDGLMTWYEFGTPDNLGIGIGVAIIILFGTPFFILLLYFRVKSRRIDASSREVMR